MQMNMKINFVTAFYFMISFFLLSALSADNVALLQNINTYDNVLEVYVNNSSSEVQFLNPENTNKIFVELLNTKYDDNFKFDVPMKNRIVEGLDFVDDVSIGQATYGEITKVGIWLYLKNGVQLEPQLTSFENNAIKISFLQRVLKSPEPEASLDDQALLIYNKAVAEQYSGNLNEAELHYEEVIKLKSDFTPAKFNLAKLYIDRKEYEKSLSLLRELADKYSIPNETNEKDFLLVSNTIGVIYLLQNNLEKALEIFNQIIEMNPDYYETYYNLGLLYEKRNDLVNAKNQFKKSIELKQDFVPAHYHLGILNLITKKKKEAIQNFRKVVELDSESNIAQLSREELDKLEK